MEILLENEGCEELFKMFRTVVASIDRRAKACEFRRDDKERRHLRQKRVSSGMLTAARATVSNEYTCGAI